MLGVILLRRNAIPWFDSIECCGRKIPLDMHIESMGHYMLPPEYESILQQHFGTKDRKKIVNSVLRGKVREVPVYCESCNTIELVDTTTGRIKVLRRNVKTAKEES